MELLGFYGAMVQVPQNAVIFHDQGNAFLSDKESVVPLIFGVKAATYPPIIHQFLSPNDNRFHGAAKEKWRSMACEKQWGKDDSVESSLALLSFLSHYDPIAVRSYFSKNLFLERKSIQPDRCMDLVMNGLLKKISKNEKIHSGTKLYQKFKDKHQAESAVLSLPQPPCLEDSLDGYYWKKN
jgi:hypothetical protein